MIAELVARLVRVRRGVRALVAVAALAVAGCASTDHYPLNAAIDGEAGRSGYRFANLDHADSSESLAVIVSFSGGGTRAAAMAYGVLEQLAATRFYWEGRERRLLDEVDVISSVSGGSVTAAYFGLRGDAIFDDFGSRFLYQDVQQEIQDRVLSGHNLSRLRSPWFGRIEIVSEVFDERLFAGATYADLIHRGKRPFVILNATDMSLGSRFAFTQEQFDLICSDLARVPLARAVAASAAVPVVFSPLTLQNYAGRCHNATQAAIGRDFSQLQPRQRQRLRELQSYLDGVKRPFIHLLDGGLVDNTGVWGTLDASLLSGKASSLLQGIELSKLRKVVFIVVSAETDPRNEVDRGPEVPILRQVAQALVDIPINRNSLESTAYFREMTPRWKEQVRKASGRDVDVYLVEASLRELGEEAERSEYMAIPTTFGLPADQVDRLRSVGARLLRESPEFRRLLGDLARETGSERKP